MLVIVELRFDKAEEEEVDFGRKNGLQNLVEDVMLSEV